jgi:hypothetical protein
MIDALGHRGESWRHMGRRALEHLLHCLWEKTARGGKYQRAHQVTSCTVAERQPEPEALLLSESREAELAKPSKERSALEGACFLAERWVVEVD